MIDSWGGRLEAWVEDSGPRRLWPFQGCGQIRVHISDPGACCRTTPVNGSRALSPLADHLKTLLLPIAGAVCVGVLTWVLFKFIPTPNSAVSHAFKPWMCNRILCVLKVSSALRAAWLSLKVTLTLEDQTFLKAHSVFQQF